MLFYFICNSTCIFYCNMFKVPLNLQLCMSIWFDLICVVFSSWFVMCFLLSIVFSHFLGFIVLIDNLS